MLQQSEAGYCVLHGRGRDMPEFSRLVKLQKSGRWKDYGRPGVELLSPRQKSCLNFLKKSKDKKGLSPKAIQEGSDIPIESVQKAMKVLCQKDFIIRKQRGRYAYRRD